MNGGFFFHSFLLFVVIIIFVCIRFCAEEYVCLSNFIFAVIFVVSFNAKKPFVGIRFERVFCLQKWIVLHRTVAVRNNVVNKRNPAKELTINEVRWRACQKKATTKIRLQFIPSIGRPIDIFVAKKITRSKMRWVFFFCSAHFVSFDLIFIHFAKKND